MPLSKSLELLLYWLDLFKIYQRKTELPEFSGDTNKNVAVAITSLCQGTALHCNCCVGLQKSKEKKTKMKNKLVNQRVNDSLFPAGKYKCLFYLHWLGWISCLYFSMQNGETVSIFFTLFISVRLDNSSSTKYWSH